MANKENQEEKKGKSKILVLVIGLLVIGLGTFAGVYLFMSKTAEKEVVIKEQYYEVGEIFVNLDEKNRYVKLNLTVSYDEKNKDLTKELEGKQVTLKDSAIYYLKSCTSEAFDASNEKALKNEMKKRLNSKLKDGVILEIYMSDIIVQ